jgi:peptidoglycan/LPS O-acetylase OafA/YrhL
VSPDGRIATPDALRGIAALLVAIFHFTAGSGLLSAWDPLARVGSYGWLGVDAFFVISGFVVPLSLLRKTPQIRSAPRFLLRRYVRVGLPYLAAGIASWCAWWASSRFYPGFQGQAPQPPTAMGLACHLTYSCDLIGRPWANGVFWTLAIEFQYYAAIAVLMPLLARMPPGAGRGLVSLVALTAFLSPGTLAFAYAPLFVQGGAVLAHRRGLLTRRALHLCLAIAALLVLIRFNPGEALAGIATALAIAHARFASRMLLWLGGISYSLYLVHGSVGGRVLNLAARWGNARELAYFSIAVALAASLAAAWIFNRLVEAPCLAWSRSVSASAA